LRRLLIVATHQGSPLADRVRQHHRAFVHHLRHPNPHIRCVITFLLRIPAPPEPVAEIQELRHQTHGDSSGAATIDTALSGLDERLGAVGVGIAAANETISPVLNSAPTPTQARAADGGEAGALGRKHAALLDEWAAVQREAELLREELREDKWLTVFRTVTEQADGMMTSLEKAIQRCQVLLENGSGLWAAGLTRLQDFLRQMRANEPIAPTLWPPDPERPPGTSPSTMEVFLALVETFEAKKRSVSFFLAAFPPHQVYPDTTFLRQIRSCPSSTRVFRTE
jgi:hypothetical protein